MHWHALLSIRIVPQCPCDCPRFGLTLWHTSCDLLSLCSRSLRSLPCAQFPLRATLPWLTFPPRPCAGICSLWGRPGEGGLGGRPRNGAQLHRDVPWGRHLWAPGVFRGDWRSQCVLPKSVLGSEREQASPPGSDAEERPARCFLSTERGQREDTWPAHSAQSGLPARTLGTLVSRICAQLCGPTLRLLPRACVAAAVTGATARERVDTEQWPRSGHYGACLLRGPVACTDVETASEGALAQL
ncbi:uncharacterized protein LOC107136554 [Marmota marmota marmota]|uniref:uncharacterized protein LOC107136554 n=1 Tax=Marmota marmota marmota TaxID=9994 RepID=UPI002093DE83|nr:uncharacterized protein LOC107136554 [Marmota marmota marmota]